MLFDSLSKRVGKSLLSICVSLLCWVIGTDAIAADNAITLDMAVKKVSSRYAEGRVLNTKEETNDSGKVYVIKLLTADSRVLHIRVDAVSGKIIEQQP